jgi:2-polyprenyl-6-methoxyphenol hydroxylase-like FAD-dependent oxidoreductase
MNSCGKDRAMTDPTRLPILVAGTGPAGLIAALALADRQVPVVLAGPRAVRPITTGAPPR